jgi:hypothetical protein
MTDPDTETDGLLTPELERIPGPDYYRSLPAPWNVRPLQPTKTPAPLSDYSKSFSNLDKFEPLKQHKFKGTIESYLSWRNMFIGFVHCKNNTLNEKVYAMFASIDTSVPILKSIGSILTSGVGDTYRQAIFELEKRFGGNHRIVDHFLNVLNASPRIQENNLRSLDNFMMDLDQMKRAFVQYGAEEDLRTSMLFRAVRKKVPGLYMDQYQTWLEATYPDDPNPPMTLFTLCRWLEIKRNRLFRLDQEQREDRLYNDKKETQAPRNCQARLFFQEEDRDLSPEPESEEALDSFSRRVQVPDVSGVSDATYNTVSNTSSGLINTINPVLPEIEPDPEVEQIFVSRSFGRLTPNCPLCDETHLYRDCQRFQKMTPEQRRQHLQEQKKCFRCFREGHTIKTCQSKIRCKTCQGDHHTLICLRKKSQVISYSNEDPPKEDIFASSHTPLGLYKSSLPIVGLYLYNPVNGKRVRVNALIDTGANRSALSRAAAKMIGLVGKPMNFSATGFGGNQTSDDDAFCASVEVSAIGKNNQKHSCQVICLENPLGDLLPDDWSVLKKAWPHLKDLDIAPVFLNEQVHMLIGTDNAHLQASQCADRAGPGGTPFARKLVFGWVVGGRMYPDQPLHKVNMLEECLEEIRPKILQ